jgi:hypothetical protein
MPAKNHESPENADASAEADADTGADAAAGTEAEPAEDKPANPLEALRRAQANRSLPPGSGNRGSAGGGGTGGSPKARRMYNRHK